MKIHAILKDRVIFTTDEGNIITEPLSQDAKVILQWFSANVPANQY